MRHVCIDNDVERFKILFETFRNGFETNFLEIALYLHKYQICSQLIEFLEQAGISLESIHEEMKKNLINKHDPRLKIKNLKEMLPFLKEYFLKEAKSLPVAVIFIYLLDMKIISEDEINELLPTIEETKIKYAEEILSRIRQEQDPKEIYHYLRRLMFVAISFQLTLNQIGSSKEEIACFIRTAQKPLLDLIDQLV